MREDPGIEILLHIKKEKSWMLLRLLKRRILRCEARFDGGEGLGVGEKDSDV